MIRGADGVRQTVRCAWPASMAAWECRPTPRRRIVQLQWRHANAALRHGDKLFNSNGGMRMPPYGTETNCSTPMAACEFRPTARRRIVQLQWRHANSALRHGDELFNSNGGMRIPPYGTETNCSTP